jgi:hypothetical protein
MRTGVVALAISISFAAAAASAQEDKGPAATSSSGEYSKMISEVEAVLRKYSVPEDRREDLVMSCKLVYECPFGFESCEWKCEVLR